MVGRWERRSWETSVSVRGENEGRQGVRTEREAQRGGTERGAKELRMSAKAKASAVIED